MKYYSQDIILATLDSSYVGFDGSFLQMDAVSPF